MKVLEGSWRRKELPFLSSLQTGSLQQPTARDASPLAASSKLVISPLTDFMPSQAALCSARHSASSVSAQHSITADLPMFP